MEFNQENRSFCTAAAVLDTVAEQLADVDITLPDYCPDIEKILKCTLTPQIQSQSLSGGRLSVEGVCSVNVMYVENVKKGVRCCEQSVSFSQSFSVKDAPDNPVIIVKTKPEYINCRALSPRRLVIHGAFSLYARVLAKTQTSVFVPPAELEADKVSLPCASLNCFCQEQFSVCEEISVSERPKIEAVLTSDLSVGVTDTKAAGGKLMVGGEVNLRMLYLTDPESGEIEKLECVVPFNRIIDCAGAEDCTANRVTCTVLSYDVRLKSDALSEKPSVVLDVKLCVTEEGYSLCSEEIVRDAYSTEFVSQPEFEQLKIMSELRPFDENHMHKVTVDVGDEKILKIIDVCADKISGSAVSDERGAAVNGKVNICVLAVNAGGIPMLVERSSDFEYVLPQSEECTALIDDVRAASVSYRLAKDNAAEVRIELKLGGVLVCESSVRAVKDVTVLEDKPLPKDEFPLTLYYADKGERLWDIAKAHGTRLDLLVNENSAEEQTLNEPRLLLIPRI